MNNLIKLKKIICLSIFFLCITQMNAQQNPNWAYAGDLDGDGALNEFDNDDDNDGITDVDEGLDCVTALVDLSSMTLTNDATTTFLDIYGGINTLTAHLINDNPSSLTPGNYFGGFAGGDGASYELSFTYPTDVVLFNNPCTATNFDPDVPLGDDLWDVRMSGGGQTVWAVNPPLPNSGGTLGSNPTGGINVTQNGTNGGGVNGQIVFSATLSDAGLCDVPITPPTAPMPSSSLPFEIVGRGDLIKYEVLNGNANSHLETRIQGCRFQDTDADGIPDHLDYDSDNDGCPDAIEGDGTLTFAGLVAGSQVSGDVDTDDTSATYGIPTAVGTGQAVGTSVDAAMVDAECEGCLSTSSLFVDQDGDGLGTECDLDDDNDGILDLVECEQSLVKSDYTQIKPSDLGITLNPATSSLENGLPASSDISTQLGLPAGTTSLSVANFALPPNSSDNFQTTTLSSPRFEIKSTVPVFVWFRHGPFINDGLADGIVTLNGDNWQYNPNGVLPAGFTSVISGNTLEIQNNSGANGSPAGDNVSWLTNGSVTNVGWSAYGENSFVQLYIRPACKDDDVDADGIVKQFDLDSDGDGCPDLSEALVKENIENNSLTVALIDGVGNDDNGIPTGDTLLEAQISPIVDADTNGFDDALESSSGVYNSTYDLTLYNDALLNNCVCYKDPLMTTADVSDVGITALNRHVNKDAVQWPSNVKSSYLALDSQEKGFVITRMTNADIMALTPQEGMIVFAIDEGTDGCLKMYNGTAWVCLEQGCVDN